MKMSMKQTLFPIRKSLPPAVAILSLILLATPGFPKSKKLQTSDAKPDQTSAEQSTTVNDLDAILAKMNQTAASFKTAQGDFQFVIYQKLGDEKDTQNGHIFFRRKANDKAKEVDAAFEITGKDPTQVVYKDGKLQVYKQNINQITEREVGKNKADVDAFLSLGFGARGDDLKRDYDVKFIGWETLDGVKTAKLDLTPKNEKMRQTYNKILLWIDPEKDILVQQQFFEPSQDYRIAHYTNMKLNQKISDSSFKLRTTGKPTVLRPQ
jgi:outer membrane lipoprotein-sorting protein